MPGGVFQSIVGDDTWELLWASGAGVDRWRQADDAGWPRPLVSPCRGDRPPDRVLLSISGPCGAYQVWTRRPGEKWVKRTQWIGGTIVARSKFAWTIDPEFRDGHAMISIPTTMPGSGNARAQYDAWIYLQDFAMARSASDLPTYEGE